MAKKFFTSDLETAGTLDVEGATTLSSTLAVTSGTQLSSTLDVAGATTLQGDLEVNGALDINVDGDMTIKLDNSTGVDDSFKIVDEDGGDLFKIYYSATGAGTIQGYSTNVNTDFFCENLVALGETTLNDNVTINNGTLDVSGMTTLSGGLTIDELTINSTGIVNTGGNGMLLTNGSVTTTGGNFVTSSGNFSSTSGNISSVSGNITTTSGNLQSTTGNVIAGGYVETSKVAATQDLILTCDFDDGSGGAGDTTSKIKFCKNSTDTEVASIDQYGTIHAAELQGKTNTHNKIELDTSGGNNLGITSTGHNVIVDFGNNYSNYMQINGQLKLPQIAAGHSNSTDDYVVGVEANPLSNGQWDGLEGTLHYNGTSNFFSQGHIYYSAVEIPVGTAVELVGSSIQPSSTANSNICIGLVAASEEDLNSGRLDSFGNTHESGWRHKIVSLGDSRYKQCNGFKVCNEGGALQPGDLLVTSSTPGYLMRQSDDIMRAKTVGKCMQAVTFDENGQAVDVYGYIYCG